MPDLWIKTRDGRQVKFESPQKAQIFGAHGELISRDTDVIYSEIDYAKAWKKLETKNSFSINIAPNPIGKQIIIVGPYGLRGGGAAGSILNKFRSDKTILINKIPQSSEITVIIDNNKSISESIELLDLGAKKQNIEDIFVNIKKLDKKPLKNFLSPKQSSFDILGILEYEWIWEKNYLLELRRKIAQLAKKLLLFAVHYERGKLIISNLIKNKILEISKSIEKRLKNKDRIPSENGLLCEIMEIKSIIGLIKNKGNWYQGLEINRKNLLEVVFSQDNETFSNLISNFKPQVMNLMSSKPWLNSLILRYLRSQINNNESALDKLLEFLPNPEVSIWNLIFAGLDMMESILLNESVQGRLQNYQIEKIKNEFLSFASFHDRRLREKVASGLAKLMYCRSLQLQDFAKKAIDENMISENNLKVKYIYDYPQIFQDAQLLIDKDWKRSTTPIDRLMDRMEKNNKYQIYKIEQLTSRVENINIGEKFIKERLNQTLNEFFNQNFRENFWKPIRDDLDQRLNSSFDKRIHMMNISSADLGKLNNTTNIKQHQNYMSRADDVQNIWEMISQKRQNRNSVSITIVGRKGDRKKQVAIEFIKKYQHKFGLIWWIDHAFELNRIKSSYNAIIEELLRVKVAREWETEAIQQLISSLQRQAKPWLLIFAGANDQSIIQSFIPKCQGVALITSKHSDWANPYMLSSIKTPISMPKDKLKTPIKSRIKKLAPLKKSLSSSLLNIHSYNALNAAAAKRMLVAVRILPYRIGTLNSNIKINGSSISISKGISNIFDKYNFDEVFAENENNEAVFMRSVSSLIRPFLSGESVSAIAYGGPGSGKTYTMDGIIPLVIREIFKVMNPIGNSLKISYIEIYNDEIRDLLAEAQRNKIRRKKIMNVSSFPVKNESQFLELMGLGNSRRSALQDAALNNYWKSKSHTILQIELFKEIPKSKFLLIDLAGKANWPYQNNEACLNETIFINESLNALENCFRAIPSNSDSIPYSASKLTSILENFFGKENKSVLLSHISLAQTKFYDTENCLKISSEARKINLLN